jgi:hypothetical protein
MATFAPSQASCPAQESDTEIIEDKTSHAWLAGSDDDFPTPGLNPVASYSLAFASQQSVFTPDKHAKRRTVYLCSGAKVRLAKPRAVRDARVKVEMQNIALQDLVYFGDYED